MVRRSKLPKSPVKGMVYTVMVRGHPRSFMATGKKGWRKYTIVRNIE